MEFPGSGIGGWPALAFLTSSKGRSTSKQEKNGGFLPPTGSFLAHYFTLRDWPFDRGGGSPFYSLTKCLEPHLLVASKKKHNYIYNICMICVSVITYITNECIMTYLIHNWNHGQVSVLSDWSIEGNKSEVPSSSLIEGKNSFQFDPAIGGSLSSLTINTSRAQLTIAFLLAVLSEHSWTAKWNGPCVRALRSSVS